jgi:hypothetical protein
MTLMSVTEYLCRFQTCWRVRDLKNHTWRKHGDPEVETRSSSDGYLSEDDSEWAGYMTMMEITRGSRSPII